jgi:hypothetical protein
MPMAKPPPTAGRLTPDPPHRPLPPCLLWGVHRTPGGVLYFFFASVTCCVSLSEREREKKKNKGREKKKNKGKWKR